MSKGEKRIGFVDYNLENFHSNVYLKLLRNELKHRGFVVAGCTGMRPRAGRTWARSNDVPYFPDAAGLNEAVDYFMVLAPSTPETHLELCGQVFPFGKPTYVDKTFAPDLRTAGRIFALADRHRVPMQTTSALRYTEVQDYVEAVGRRQVRHMVTWGGGRSLCRIRDPSPGIGHQLYGARRAPDDAPGRRKTIATAAGFFGRTYRGRKRIHRVEYTLCGFGDHHRGDTALPGRLGSHFSEYRGCRAGSVRIRGTRYRQEREPDHSQDSGRGRTESGVVRICESVADAAGNARKMRQSSSTNSAALRRVTASHSVAG